MKNEFEIYDTLDGINILLDTAKEKISRFEDTAIETIQNEHKGEKNFKKLESPEHQHSNIHVIGREEGHEQKKKIFE